MPGEHNISEKVYIGGHPTVRGPVCYRPRLGSVTPAPARGRGEGAEVSDACRPDGEIRTKRHAGTSWWLSGDGCMLTGCHERMWERRPQGPSDASG